ncbi:uncharacterized protein LOC131930795 [Physella acuta]|uniref:uncharacterized protein LOC131930795 n=1 Tax=Physella acuta TaxID=109671 RepID=UPI0027DABC33|nr:uncharacterized protein LOC131930795 [Physella acuta]
MEHGSIAVLLAFLTVAVCAVYCKETVQSNLGTSSSDAHTPQKRSPPDSPVPLDDDALLSENDLLENQLNPDDFDKRSTLFRFGKRQGSLFRFGKRGGSLFRFGKRGTLLRFGKRGGSLFRFGRSGPSDSALDENEAMDDKRTLFRFGKRSDLDLLRDALAQAEYSNYPYLNDVDKRASFHWGEDSDE